MQNNLLPFQTMLNKFPGDVMKVRSNLLSDSGYNKSIRITIARKKKHRVQKKNSCSLETKAEFRNKRHICRLKAFIKGLL